MIKYVNGDLIKLAKEGKFNVIVHGCNCMSNMGAGIALAMKNNFSCDTFEMETWGATIEKLGNIDYKTIVIGEHTTWWLDEFKNNRNEPEVTIVNAYTQYEYGKGKVNVDYSAIDLCMKKINNIFKGKKIGLPKIGAGLAKGDWNQIEKIISNNLKDCDVTVVNFKE